MTKNQNFIIKIPENTCLLFGNNRLIIIKDNYISVRKVFLKLLMSKKKIFFT